MIFKIINGLTNSSAALWILQTDINFKNKPRSNRSFLNRGQYCQCQDFGQQNRHLQSKVASTLIHTVLQTSSTRLWNKPKRIFCTRVFLCTRVKKNATASIFLSKSQEQRGGGLYPPVQNANTHTNFGELETYHGIADLDSKTSIHMCKVLLPVALKLLCRNTERAVQMAANLVLF